MPPTPVEPPMRSNGTLRDGRYSDPLSDACRQLRKRLAVQIVAFLNDKTNLIPVTLANECEYEDCA